MIGTVLFWKAHENRPGFGFGFIVPDGDGANSRAANYWFGPKALAGLIVHSGDRVDFDPGDFRPGKGPQAAHVRFLGGQDDVNKNASPEARSSEDRTQSGSRSREGQEREHIETIPGADDY